MATTNTTGLYEFDPYGNSPDNLIVDEGHALQVPGRDDYYFIIPKAAPFFATTLEVKSATGVVYTEGVDYLLGHTFVEATQQTGKVVGGSVRFLRRDITGMVYLRYQTMGGEWGFDADAILQELSNKLVNPLIRSWAEIDPLPNAFPPVPHDQSVDEIIGFDEVTESLESIRREIEAASAGATQAHVQDRDNPHQVTKVQVGLGSVKNYPTASDTEASEAVRNDRYLTPASGRSLVNELAGVPHLEHVQDRDNPHRVTKAHVGLGSVENYPTASILDTITGETNAKYTTPRGVREAIANAMGGEVSDHFTDTNNPHHTTKAQVGLGNVHNYGLAETGDMITGSSNTLYTTPKTVQDAINHALGGGDISDHFTNTDNPHQVTAEQVGSLTEIQINQLLDRKQDADKPIFDSNAVYGLSKPELFAELSGVSTENSERLGGSTLDEVIAMADSAGRVLHDFTTIADNDYACILERNLPETEDPEDPEDTEYVYNTAYVISCMTTSGGVAVAVLSLGVTKPSVNMEIINSVLLDTEVGVTIDDELLSVWVRATPEIESVTVSKLTGVEEDGVFIPDLTVSTEKILPSLASENPTFLDLVYPNDGLVATLTDAFNAATLELM